MAERILVVEDEPAIADAVSYALQEAGYAVDAVGDAGDALEVARGRRYDLMVLDLMLAGGSGLDVCREVRASSDLPIVMLTARDTETDRVLGLEVGADDYVTKPFSVAELVSRVRALLRRRALDRTRGDFVRRVGGLELDVAHHTAALGGRPLDLTRSEFRLLTLLASKPGGVFTRDEILRHLRAAGSVGDRRAIDVHVSNLRRKVEQDPRNPRRLQTVRGVGYRLVAVSP
ncbi:MAG: two-component system, OmpR family, alkaline phosphatase synthesis response regulator PhoP [Actinomycetota bacterium]|jgi:DNA-binding response OmpR family regulator